MYLNLNLIFFPDDQQSISYQIFLPSIYSLFIFFHSFLSFSCIYSFLSPCALFASLSALSMATMFSDATHRCTRLMPAFTTATGQHTTQMKVNRPKERGPNGTETKAKQYQSTYLCPLILSVFITSSLLCSPIIVQQFSLYLIRIV